MLMKSITALLLTVLVSVSFIGCQTTKKECPMTKKCPPNSKTCCKKK